MEVNWLTLRFNNQQSEDSFQQWSATRLQSDVKAIVYGVFIFSFAMFTSSKVIKDGCLTFARTFMQDYTAVTQGSFFLISFHRDLGTTNLEGRIPAEALSKLNQLQHL